ncbi:MAG: hydrolase [Micavibrio sp.]|nr:hydrolase [Micavibrio sp.]|tara:strand:- start:2157 stop:2867 length:711 start_codon:yes stop_codon:yes gene_type:complete
MPINTTGLVIFDCDGTLIDSEMLYNTVISDLLCEAGLDMYTPGLCLERFTGLTLSAIRAQAEQAHNMDLSSHLAAETYVRRAQQQMDVALSAIAGADVLIARAKERGKICVASNGERSSVLKSLKLTSLYDYFETGESQIFTKVQVENAKPAPDLFLFAADKMQVQTKDCVVVEDSVAGVQAGLAAGMHVIGFTGSHHAPAAHAKVLKSAGAHRIFSDLIHIADYLSGEKGLQKTG